MANSDLALDLDDDPLDPSNFHLETDFYTSGHTLGLSEGSHAGKIEGRLFGLEKGFEKFAEMGRLRGRAEVWSARFDVMSTPTTTMAAAAAESGDGDGYASGMKLTPLLSQGSKGGNGNERLAKRIERLKALTDPETLDRENSEEAVDEVDERLRDARAREVVIASIVGDESYQEAGSEAVGETGKSVRKDGLRVKGTVEASVKAKGSGEMEDFAGLPGSRR